MTKRILRLPDVIASTGLSRSSIYAYMKAGDFPKSVVLGARSVGWLEADIVEWIEQRISQSGASKL